MAVQFNQQTSVATASLLKMQVKCEGESEFSPALNVDIIDGIHFEGDQLTLDSILVPGREDILVELAGRDLELYVSFLGKIDQKMWREDYYGDTRRMPSFKKKGRNAIKMKRSQKWNAETIHVFELDSTVTRDFWLEILDRAVKHSWDFVLAYSLTLEAIREKQ